MLVSQNTLRVKAKPYTQDETSTLKNLWLKGYTCTQIAKQLNRRIGSVENRVKYLRKTGQLKKRSTSSLIENTPLVITEGVTNYEILCLEK